MHYQISNRDRGEVAALVLSPAFTAIDADPQSELGAKEQKVAIDCVFFDDVRVPTHTALLHGERLPGFTEIGGLEDVRTHVAMHVAIESRISRALIVAAGL